MHAHTHTSVAQWVEHLPRKQYVVGSNPTRAALFSFFLEKRRSGLLYCLVLIYVGITVPM